MENIEAIKKYIENHPQITKREAGKKFGLSKKRINKIYAEIQLAREVAKTFGLSDGKVNRIFSEAQKSNRAEEAIGNKFVDENRKKKKEKGKEKSGINWGKIKWGYFEKKLRSSGFWLKAKEWNNLPANREKALLVNLFLLALFVRALYFLALRKNPLLTIPMLDAKYYIDWAKEILEKGWLGNKVFFTEPLYAYILAVFYKFSAYGDVIMIGLQAILGSILPVVVAGIGKKIFNRNIGILSGVVAALYGPFVFYEGLVLKTTFEVVFLSVFVLLLINIFLRKNKRQYFFAGVFLGFLTLVKGNNLLIAPLLIYFIFRYFEENRDFKFRLAGIFLAGMLLVILPVTIRNYVVGNDFVPINYSLGMNFYQGNRQGTDGALLQPAFVRPDPKFEETDSSKMAEAYREKPLKPSEISSFWFGKTISEILEKPGMWITLEGKKILLLFNKTELGDNYDYAYFRKNIWVLQFMLNFWPVATLGIIGVVVALFFGNDSSLRENVEEKIWNKEEKKETVEDTERKMLLRVVLGITFIYATSILAFHVNSRYRMPFTPFMIIFSSAAVSYIIAKIRTADFLQVAGVFLGSCALFIVTSVHLTNFDFMTDATFYNNIGSDYLDKKQDMEAEQYFRKAIDADDKYAWAFGNLFTVYLKHTEFSLAKENLQKKIVLRPDDFSGYSSLKTLRDLKGKTLDEVQKYLDDEEKKRQDADKKNGVKNKSYDPFFNEATRYLEQGNTKKAQSFFEKSADQFGDPESTLINLAYLKKSQDDVEGARNLLQEIVDKNPDFIPAKYNLANIYIKEQNWDKVSELLKGVYEDVPEFGGGEAWYYLAVAYIKTGKFDEATPVVKDFIARYENDSNRTKKEQAEKFKSLLKPTGDSQKPEDGQSADDAESVSQKKAVPAR
jgi:tetratricopeptide (TPR) repeat protein/4-amino-4-deoxy-L-arabinose transferase-like glycosyltransferase